MKNLKILNKTIRLTPTRIFVFTTLGLLIFGVALRLITPQVSVVQKIDNLPIITPPEQLKNIIPDTEIKISPPSELPKIPKEITVYRKTNSVIMSVLAQSIAESFNLRPVESREYTWAGSGTAQSLTYSVADSRISYLDETETTTTTIDREKAISTASNFVNATLQTNNLKPDLLSIGSGNYGLGENINLGGATATASLYVVPFTQSLDDYNLTIGRSAIKPVEIWVGPEYQIVKAVIRDFIPSFEAIGEYKTLSSSTILNAIKSGQGSIIDLSSSSYGVPVDSPIDSINLGSARIEYRLENSDIIYPYLSFYGKALLKNNNIANVRIIYPIVHTISN